ncbi:hypothetical protein [uncultured Roseobacter sp.]|nr:hypothetical protein [uncultured Roseobacter sp.]
MESHYAIPDAKRFENNERTQAMNAALQAWSALLEIGIVQMAYFPYAF